MLLRHHSKIPLTLGRIVGLMALLFKRLMLRSESTRRGDGRRNRPAARDRTTIIDPGRHPTRHPTRHLTRSGIEATAIGIKSKQHQ